MLSRVAAVKAPRTNNRCLVTGSSGRRKEGRESEPQSANMSRRVLASAVLLLLFVLTRAAAGAVQTQNYGTRMDNSYGRHSLERLPREYPVANTAATGHTFRNPHLVNVDGMLLAIVGAQFNGSVGSGSASMQLMARISNDGGRTWQSYAGPEDLDAFAAHPYRMSFPPSFGPFGPLFAFVEGYDLRNGAIIRFADERGSVLESLIHFLETGPGRSGGFSLNSVSMSIRPPYPHKSEDLIGFLNDASTPITKMTDNTLVFPVQFLTFGGSTASTVMYSNSVQQRWTFAKSATHAGCTNPSILEWEAGKIIMIASCKYGRRRVYESTDKGNTWKEAVGTLSRVWSNSLAGLGLHIQSGFITATIGGKKVILLTQLEYSRHDGKNEIRLWLTDTNRIYQVGLLPTGNSATSSSLLYANDKLYCLYEAGVGSNSGTFFLDLTSELQKIWHALDTWAAKDNALSRQCSSIASGAALSRGNCSVPIPTAGLVGHLANNSRGDKWEDEYLGVNAVVRGAAKKVPNGLTFEGRSAGAEWPVDKQWPTRPLHFANYGFTLAATVSIHEVPTGITPLMGLKRMGKTTLLGLSYDNNMGWRVEHGSYPRHLTEWELNKTYHVVLKMRDGVGSVYVDGKSLLNLTLPRSSDELMDAVSHFYFGAYDEQLSSVKIHATVANVFLYNRPLNGTEIGALNANKVSLPFTEKKPAKASTATSPSVEPLTTSVATETQPTVPAPTPAKPQPTEQVTSNGSSGASDGDALTPAVSNTTTPTAEERSADQSASVTSSSAASSKDGTSLSDDAQTVRTEVVDNKQGDQPTQASVGISDAANGAANPKSHAAESKGQEEPAVATEGGVSSGENGETAGGADGQEEDIQPQDGEAKAAALGLALKSSLGNSSQRDDSVAGTMRESRVLLPLHLLLLGLWGFAAL
ncbi:putative trans-sialidase, Group IV [Trypanosoma cruzi]|uniref:Putative trans-sialidase, Group IV n=1 Tax=Trypanosoma cruzi TaxID=5693 RepID=A0A2V2UNY7_TRYCR|nr:putative trans-sialidase, Group IV [Trypanosoma cruzi]